MLSLRIWLSRKKEKERKPEEKKKEQEFEKQRGWGGTEDWGRGAERGEGRRKTKQPSCICAYNNGSSWISYNSVSL